MLKQIMLGYSDTEQYIYVLEAGRILRKIHSIPAPATQEDWEIRFNRIGGVLRKPLSLLPAL